MDQQSPATQTSFSQVCSELIQLHASKNHDYGNAFADTYQHFVRHDQQKMADGYAAGMLSVKVARINSLLMTDAWVKDESIDDSLADLASYAIMYLIERRRK